jgi:hypothetical protein
MTSGQTLLRQAPRPRPHSRGEDKLSKPKSRRPGAQMAPTISSATRPSPAATQEVDPFLKATLPTRVFRHRGLSLHQRAPGSSPYDTGAGSHATCKLARDRRSQTAACGACNCPAVTSTPPSPKPAGERADRHAGGMQLYHEDAPFRLRRIQHGGPGPHVM